ncbi:MAG: dihydroneopterin aldolase [Lentimonas sp.]|jgi:dihydroneopterin aldolase
MNKTRIELKNLVFFAYHGVLEEEAKMGQRFNVDVLLTLEAGLEFGADTTEQTVNYVEVYALVKEVVENKRFNLIERLAELIANEILQKFSKVTESTIKIRKPSVPVDCVCDYFAVEVTQCR